MIFKFVEWILDYSSYFLVFPVSIAILRFRFITKELRYILLLIALSIITELVMYLIVKAGIRNNLFIVHIYTILHFNIIALFYYGYFGYFYHRSLVPSMMVLFTTFAIVNSLFFQKLTEFNTNTLGLECIFVIVLCILCFYKIITELTVREPEKKPIFWINTGFLFYFSGNIVLFILSNVLLKENKDFNYLSWGLHALLNSILQIFKGVGLWFSPHQK
jgi:hypothetical protein